MALPIILSMDADVRPYIGLDVCDGNDTLLRMTRRFTETQARKFTGHGIAQNTYTNEYYRQYAIGMTIDSDLVSLVGTTVYLGSETGAVDGHVLQLKNGFVTSITEVREDTSARFNESGKFGAATVLTADTDYYLEMDNDTWSTSGRLIRRNRDWPSTPGTIRVTYVAGFTAAQLNDEFYFVKAALLDDMRTKFNYAVQQQGGTEFTGQKKKETYFGDYSVEYDTQGVMAQSVAGGVMMDLTDAAKSRLQPLRRLAL